MDAKKIDELEAIALEMQQIYYANERHMDECFYGERLGLDNVTGNLGTYELWWAINDYAGPGRVRREREAVEVQLYQASYG